MSKFRFRESTIALLVLLFTFASPHLTPLKVALALAALLLFSRRGVNLLVDKFSILLLFSLAAYYFGRILSGYGFENSWSLVLLPVLAYVYGKWYGLLRHDERGTAAFYVLLGTCLASIYLVSIFFDVYNNGFIGLGRSIEVIGGSDEARSATVVAGNLVVLSALTGLIFCKSDSLGLMRKSVLAMLVGINILATLRLGSRTNIFLIILCLLLGYFLNYKHYGKKGRVFLLIFISATFAAVFFSLSEESVALNYYADRLGNDETGVGSVGGRLEKWQYSIEKIITDPMGWDLNQMGYAHNLWLDAARAGGAFSAVLLLFFSIESIRAIARAFRRSAEIAIPRTLIACAAVSFFALFMLEPILDGFIYPFSAFCAFLGFVVGSARALRHKRVATQF